MKNERHSSAGASDSPMPHAGPDIAPYLRDLNPRQVEAVETLDGPVLVLAGAGTGKTRTLTARIAHIMCTGRAWPSQILAVTFTNKAAAEMRERVERAVPMQVGAFPWLGTFHAISARILREHAERAGRKPQIVPVRRTPGWSSFPPVLGVN